VLVQDVELVGDLPLDVTAELRLELEVPGRDDDPDRVQRLPVARADREQAWWFTLDAAVDFGRRDDPPGPTVLTGRLVAGKVVVGRFRA
ncbi:hypothetical protein K7G98_40580, partial [Saccharothrix sp. MB29]|nr:hypothetical protein [Saccharothrix sp. MB29]